MKFNTYQEIFSAERIQRYMCACSDCKRKALLLYRLNLHLSQEVFAVISCFEVALRNAIDKELTKSLGTNWLRDAILPGGILDTPKTIETRHIITFQYNKQMKAGTYTHSHLLSGLEFGVWKYMFSSPLYKATGQVLLNVFPAVRALLSSLLTEYYVWNIPTG